MKGRNIIYEPKGQALEYSELACNPYSGCGHKCAYCYVPKILRQKSRVQFDSAATPRADFIKKLTADGRKYKDARETGQVMLSFTTDPYHPFDTSLTRETIKTLKEFGLSFCTLTKGGTRSLRDLDLFRRGSDSFATTLTSLDDKFSKKWEPGAALPSDRLSALKTFYDSGIFTWVSLEPTLDVNASIDIINASHEFVNHYKIGRANYLPMTKTTDWEAYTHNMIDLCSSLGVSHYIKKDLQKYLPDGYHNPLRINQFHAEQNNNTASLSL